MWQEKLSTRLDFLSSPYSAVSKKELFTRRKFSVSFISDKINSINKAFSICFDTIWLRKIFIAFLDLSLTFPIIKQLWHTYTQKHTHTHTNTQTHTHSHTHLYREKEKYERERLFLIAYNFERNKKKLRFNLCFLDIFFFNEKGVNRMSVISLKWLLSSVWSIEMFLGTFLPKFTTFSLYFFKKNILIPTFSEPVFEESFYSIRNIGVENTELYRINRVH